MIIPNFTALDETATLPTQAYNDDSGVDLYLAEDIIIPAGGSVKTDIWIAWNPEFAGWVDPVTKQNYKIDMIIQSRSGKAINEDIEGSNAGVIDSGYRGSIVLKLYNKGFADRTYPKGTAIAQGCISIKPRLLGVKTVHEGDRGVKGFGSSDRT